MFSFIKKKIPPKELLLLSLYFRISIPRSKVRVTLAPDSCKISLNWSSPTEATYAPPKMLLSLYFPVQKLQWLFVAYKLKFKLLWSSRCCLYNFLSHNFLKWTPVKMPLNLPSSLSKIPLCFFSYNVFPAPQNY